MGSERDFLTVGGDTIAPQQAAAGRSQGATEGNKSRDRGSRRGAKWFIVDGQTIYTKKLADEHNIKGILFRSGKEAKRWVSLLVEQEAGAIRNLRRGRAVWMPLQARRPDGLMETVAHYIPDFVYDKKIPVGTPGTGFCPGDTHGWLEVIEDTKPSGKRVRNGKKVPFREEIYELKKRWFEIQYGKRILET